MLNFIKPDKKSQSPQICKVKYDKKFYGTAKESLQTCCYQNVTCSAGGQRCPINTLK